MEWNELKESLHSAVYTCSSASTWKISSWKTKYSKRLCELVNYCMQEMGKDNYLFSRIT